MVNNKPIVDIALVVVLLVVALTGAAVVESIIQKNLCKYPRVHISARLSIVFGRVRDEKFRRKLNADRLALKLRKKLSAKTCQTVFER